MTATTVTTLCPPPLDSRLVEPLALVNEMYPATFTPDMIPMMREFTVALTQETLDEAGIESRQLTIAGYDGGQIVVSIVQPKGRKGTGPGFYYIHGGGMVVGDQETGLDTTFPWLHRHNGVAVSVDYRLAPEFPDPTPVEDCYAGLLWTAEHARELGIDLNRLVIVGASAGGGLAAGTALLARDRQGPQAVGQMLFYPMLDDRDQTVSTLQYEEVGTWTRASNVTGWTALLGERKGTDDVSIYAAPARATDLSGLPPAFIDCGSAEVFRDEDVAYASAIWASGGQAELHVWPGGFHAFELTAPHVPMAQQMVEARANWLERILEG